MLTRTRPIIVSRFSSSSSSKMMTWGISSRRMNDSVGNSKRNVSCHRMRSCQWMSTTSRNIDEDILYEELKRLSQQLRDRDQEYYSGVATVSDEEYDSLARREEELCSLYPELQSKLEKELNTTRATRKGRVGIFSSTTTTTERKRRTFLQPMQSLDNGWNDTHVSTWIQRVINHAEEDETVEILMEPKLDGLSLNLRYILSDNDNNNTSYELQWGATRGDGTSGEDVTAAVHQISNIPTHFKSLTSSTKYLDIRGEVIFPKSTFSNSAISSSYSNSRNAASGILLRHKESEEEETKELQSKLKFYAYSLVCDDESSDASNNGREVRDRLQNSGFTVPEPFDVVTLSSSTFASDINDSLPRILKYYQKVQEDYLDFDVDGAVYKVSSFGLRQSMGQSNRAPKWAIAHKFPPTLAVTTLQNITVQVGRTGSLTPVAILSPVEIGGVNITRATLHNFDMAREILGEDISSGISVLVSRAGDVIPQVMKRVDTTKQILNDQTPITLTPPSFCPSCGSATSKDDIVVRCINVQCPSRSVQSMVHAFSRPALDIPGLSEARLQQFQLIMNIQHPYQVFSLTSDELEQMPRWGALSAQNLLKNLDVIKKRGVSLSRFLYSLGIRHAGQHSCALLAEEYGSVDNFFLSLKNETLLDSLLEIKGIGPVLVDSLKDFSHQLDLVKASQQLAKIINIHPVNKPSSNNIDDTVTKPWNGWTVVFTGALKKGNEKITRSQAQELAKHVLGASSTPSSISKSTNLLVIGEENVAAKKLEKAKLLGLPILTCEEFQTLVKEHTNND